MILLGTIGGVLADVMIRVNVPNELQGRAWGIIGFISQMGYVAAYALAGPLADSLYKKLLHRLEKMGLMKRMNVH